MSYRNEARQDEWQSQWLDAVYRLGLRACWSTPIRNTENAVIGTFAVYHRAVGRPTADEIEAIRLITNHVAQAIMWSRDLQDLEPPAPRWERNKARLKVVLDHPLPDGVPGGANRLLQTVRKLESHAQKLERHAATCQSQSTCEAVSAAAADCRRLVSLIGTEIERYGC
jgi:hypothetical protein